MTQSQSLGLLRKALGNPRAEFREGQWEAIRALVEHSGRLLVVQRTGWGKSLVYFLATRLLRDKGYGCTLLVSPLLALTRNQIAAARNLGLRAETINSSNTADWPEIQERLAGDQVDVLLISPEMLANDAFVNRCLLPIANRIGLFVVDELDGPQHLGDPAAYRRDRRKDQLLQENGYMVLRFLAEDVAKHLDVVLDAILRVFVNLRKVTTLNPPAMM